MATRSKKRVQRRTRVVVLTPLSRQVIEQATEATTKLLANLPDKSAVQEEIDLVAVARLLLEALVARQTRGALFDDGSDAASFSDAQIEQLVMLSHGGNAASALAAEAPSGGGGSGDASPSSPPPPPSSQNCRWVSTLVGPKLVCD